MKKILVSIGVLLSISGYASEQSQTQADVTGPVEFTVHMAPKKFAKTKLMLAIVEHHPDSDLEQLAHIIKQDLEFTGQFEVELSSVPTLHKKKELEELAQRNYPLGVFLNKSGHTIEWRIYDLALVEMIKGGRYHKRGQHTRGWAHNVADSLWPALTGQEGFFSTKVAYCQDVYCPKKKKVKYIYIADYDGSNNQLLVSIPTVNVAPRWNNDAQKPLLFYSEYTNSNVRLVGVTLDKKRKIASNFDGINMLPAFSSDGKKVAYCASKGAGCCQIYYYEQGKNVQQVTQNKGNNVSPVFSADGNALYFCSDYQTGQPQLYCYDFNTQIIQRITQGGYCASPTLCAKTHKLAYAKMVGGIMQLFVYDLISKEHMQLTFDKGSKEECTWSTCGNYLLFSVEQGQQSRIALQNVLTNKRHYLTGEKQVCSYPAWSPTYNEFPIIA